MSQPLPAYYTVSGEYLAQQGRPSTSHAAKYALGLAMATALMAVGALMGKQAARTELVASSYTSVPAMRVGHASRPIALAPARPTSMRMQAQRAGPLDQDDAGPYQRIAMAARSGKPQQEDDYYDTPSGSGRTFWLIVGSLFFVIPIGGLIIGVVTGIINIPQ